MTTLEARAQAAHREAFALVTTAINNPAGVDLEPSVIDYASRSDEPVQALLDLAQVLVWHAAGAILTHTGSREAALELVQFAALEQEMKH